MTSATRKALAEVYSILLREGWDEPNGESVRSAHEQRDSAVVSQEDPRVLDYLHDIYNSPPLTAEQERELAVRMVAGDPTARAHMLRANLRLVDDIARGYLGKGLALDDLIGEGNLGLIRAVDEYDDSLQARFSTIASYWIKQSIRDALVKNGNKLDEREANVIRMRFGFELHAPMTLREVGEKLGLPREQVQELEKQALAKLMYNLEPDAHVGS